MATTSQPSSDAASQLGAPLLAVPSSSSKSARMTFEKRPRPSKSTTCSCSLGHFVGKLKERMRSEIPSFRLPGDILNSFLLSVTVGAYYVGNYVEQVAIAGESPVAYQSYNIASSALNIFFTVFYFLQRVAIQLAASQDEKADRLQENPRIGKLFRQLTLFCIGATAFCCVLFLPLLQQIFDLTGQGYEVSPDIQVYAYFRTPMSFFFFWDMALSGILMGLAYTVETTVISSLSIALMVALSFVLPSSMDNKILAAALVNTSRPVFTCLCYFAVFCHRSLRSRFHIFRFTKLKLLIQASIPKFCALMMLEHLVTSIVGFTAVLFISRTGPIANVSYAASTSYPSIVVGLMEVAMVYQNLVGSRLAIRERYRSYRFVFLFSHVLGTFFYVIGLIVGLTWAYDYMSGKMYSSLVVEELVSPIVDRVEPAFLVEMGLLLMSKVYQMCFLNFQRYQFLVFTNILFRVVFGLGAQLILYYGYSSVTLLISIPAILPSAVGFLVYGSLAWFWILPSVRRNERLRQQQGLHSSLLLGSDYQEWEEEGQGNFDDPPFPDQKRVTSVLRLVREPDEDSKHADSGSSSDSDAAPPLL